jgi:hypothetical protein
MCKFDISWVGVCKNEGEPYCDEHKGVKCKSCGEQATHDCEETYMFVCGIPLCDNCKCPCSR